MIPIPAEENYSVIPWSKFINTVANWFYELITCSSSINLHSIYDVFELFELNTSALIVHCAALRSLIHSWISE